MRRFAAGLAALCLLTGGGRAAEVVYPDVVSGEAIEFPRDEGSHPSFRTEWWYVTGWVQDGSDEPLGFQITFFRTRPGIDEDNPSRFAARQLLFAHAAVSEPARGTLLRAEKSAREGFGLAAAARGALDVHIDDWSLRAEGERYVASVATDTLQIELELVPTQPPLLQGERGYSRKGHRPTSASYYYSLPQLRASGRIVLQGRERRVRGVAWMDHEWSSSILEAPARGWDWVGLNLDDGGALMAFQIRDEQFQEYWAAASLRDARGAATQYQASQVQWTPLRQWRSPRTGVRYPIEWRLTVGDRVLTLRPLMNDQENDARRSTGTLYWEGAVRAFDAEQREVGKGYLELTGYGSRLRF